MEQKVTKPWMQGLIISLITIVLSMVLYFADLWQNKAIGSIQYVILIGGIIYACINYAKEMNGAVSFGNVFAHGFKVTATIMVITIIYTIISVKLLFPEMVDKIIDESIKGMQEKNMNEDQIGQAISMTKKFFIPFAIGGILFGYGIIGAIASAIGAAAAKKNPNPNPF